MPSEKHKLSVLVITRAYGLHAGGMERLSYELTQALKNDPEVEVKVIAHTGPRWAFPFFMTVKFPAILFAARKSDVVHIGDPVLSKIGWFVKTFLKKPVVVTVHGLDVLYANPIYRLYLQLFFRYFNAYLCISEFAKKSAEKWQVTGEALVINPGISDSWYDPRATAGAAPLTLFTSGRLVKRKGHVWFIENVLPKLPPQVQYVIAGIGPEENAIKTAAQKSGVSDRVQLLGRISEAELKKLYNTVDAFIQPNIHVKNDAEGFGLVLLEAASCARPVFAANLEGIPDAIHDQKNGYLLPSADADAWIQKLMDFVSNFESYKARAAQARKYTLAHFKWTEKGREYKELLKKKAEG